MHVQVSSVYILTYLHALNLPQYAPFSVFVYIYTKTEKGAYWGRFRAYIYISLNNFLSTYKYVIYMYMFSLYPYLLVPALWIQLQL